MDNSRNFIIERLKSKKVTIDEFNFDKLSAPPLSMFFFPQDIWELNQIAKSIKLSGKLPQKLKMIDDICKRRGLIKFGSGTNRVVYRHPEFNQFVFKIAYDNVALMDNFNELRNQYVLKPFVAKTFEVSPCGTVAICERVKPITSREEFISIADDVFTLLNEFIIGKYIMSDIGTEFFCNFGLREFSNFGPVLLDYSFLYELDENKIYCNKPDPTSPSGLCEGEIGYDDGFNHLYCSKCGAKYKAIELKKKIKDNEIIVREKGEAKMKIRISGGSTNTNKVIETETNNNDNFLNTVGNIIRCNVKKDKPIKTSNKIAVKLGESKEAKPTINIKPAIEKVEQVEEEIAVNGVTVSSNPAKMNIDEFIDSLPDDKIIEEDEAIIDLAFSRKEKVVEEELESPFTIDESLIGEREIRTGKNPVELIDEAVDSIIENLNNITIDAVKDDAVNRMISKIVEVIPANGDAFKNVIEVAISIFDNAEDNDYIDVVHSEKFVNFIQRVFDPYIDTISIDRDGSDLVVGQQVKVAYAYDANDVAFETETKTCRIQEVFTEAEEENTEAKTETEQTEEKSDEYNGIEFANGMIINAKELFPAAENDEIIVGIDENGDYLTTSEGNIIGINVINDCEVNSVSLVSKDWIKSVSKILEADEKVENQIAEDTIGVAQVTEE